MLAVTKGLTRNTVLMLSPLTAKVFAPGPSMLRSVAIVITPLFSVMTWQDPFDRGNLKRIASPGVALVTASRSEPGPESRQLVTYSVIGDGNGLTVSDTVFMEVDPR